MPGVICNRTKLRVQVDEIDRVTCATDGFVAHEITVAEKPTCEMLRRTSLLIISLPI